MMMLGVIPSTMVTPIMMLVGVIPSMATPVVTPTMMLLAMQ
jgi:hypothetical protein